MKILMSKHAQEQWRKRIGGEPPRNVSKLIDECVILQQRRILYTPKGVAYKVLGLYWHPDLRVFFKVDKRYVVTILAAKDLKTNLNEPVCKADVIE